MEFVLQQAGKRAKATIDLAKSITDRAVTIMQFSIPLAIALIGLIIAEPETGLLWFYLAILAVTSISFISLRVYDRYDIEPIGFQPSELLNEDDLLLENEDQRLGFIFNAIVHLQRRIVSN